MTTSPITKFALKQGDELYFEGIIPLNTKIILTADITKALLCNDEKEAMKLREEYPLGGFQIAKITISMKDESNTSILRLDKDKSMEKELQSA